MNYKKMKIGICDDDKIWLKRAESILKDYFDKNTIETEIQQFQNQQELMESVDSLDMLFMDIDLNEANGIEIVQEINLVHPGCFTVYLTNYIYYATDVYESKHDYFVLKEQFEDRLDAILKLYNKTKQLKEGKLALTSIDKTTSVVPVNYILYVERSARTTKVVTPQKVYVIKMKIEEIEKELSRYGFIRTHKSFMVNPWYVSECRKTAFIIEDGREIPISRRFEKSSRESFLQWASSHLI